MIMPTYALAALTFAVMCVAVLDEESTKVTRLVIVLLVALFASLTTLSLFYPLNL